MTTNVPARPVETVPTTPVETVPARPVEPAAAGSSPAETPPIAPELRIVEWQNEWIVRSAFGFAYQGPDALLQELRERYRLDEVVAAGRDEFAQLLLLREWVHTRWRHGWTRTPPAQNALAILRAAEQGSDFNCGYYSVTLTQCLSALGFVARQVSIGKAAGEWIAADEGNIGHSVVEVWSHQYHKWVLLDPDLNVHYEQDDVPLSALEIHRAWVRRRWDDVRLLQGPTPYRMTDQRSSGYGVVRKSPDHHLAEAWIFTRHRVGDYYAHLGIGLGNAEPAADTPFPVVQWIDEWTPARVISSGRPYAGRWTGNEHDLYWSVDQVQIDLAADDTAWTQGRAVLRVTLDHSMPNLARLLVRLDDEPWRESAPAFSWPLHPGKNQIMAKGVNAFGREGHTSRILLRYHP